MEGHRNAPRPIPQTVMHARSVADVIVRLWWTPAAVGEAVTRSINELNVAIAACRRVVA